MIYKRTAIILAAGFLLALGLVCLKLRNDSLSRPSIETSLPGAAARPVTPATPVPSAAP